VYISIGGTQSYQTTCGVLRRASECKVILTTTGCFLWSKFSKKAFRNKRLFVLVIFCVNMWLTLLPFLPARILLSPHRREVWQRVCMSLSATVLYTCMHYTAVRELSYTVQATPPSLPNTLPRLLRDHSRRATAPIPGPNRPFPPLTVSLSENASKGCQTYARRR